MTDVEADAEADPGELGDIIARLEMELIELANHPDRYIRVRALRYLARVEAMKQELWNAIQDHADAQAGDNLD